MSMRLRKSWVLGHYKDIEPDLDNIEKCERFYRHYCYLEQYKLSVPCALKLYVAKYLHTLHIAHCEKLPAKKSKKGRQPTVISNTYLAMLIWYRFYFAKKRKSKNKVGASKYEIIADSISVKDAQSCRAAVLDSNLDSIGYSDSEATVKRTIRRFRDHGFFYDPILTNVENEIQAETFCVLVLGMSVEKAASHKYEIINYWLKNHDKKQDQ
jgi:hypothetical protein